VKTIERLESRNDSLEITLRQILNWCEAYPLGFVDGMFDEPDWTKVRELLGDTLLTQVTASNMRHVIKGVERIIHEADVTAKGGTDA
jgi:hypothetical protein